MTTKPDAASRDRYPTERLRQFVVGCFVAMSSLAVMTYFAVQPGFSKATWKSVQEISRHYMSGNTTCELHSEASQEWKPGDAVFAFVGDRWEWVGAVRESSIVGQETKVVVEWTHPYLTPNRAMPWEYYETPQSMAWVANVMLPEEKVKQLSRELVDRFQSRQHELAIHFEPVIIQTIRDLVPVVEERFRDSLRGQQPAIEEVTSRYQSDIFEKQILPMVKSEIMPIVQARSQKLVTTVGAELFDRVSVWSFTWRYLYDVLPLTERDLVQAEFSRFVKDDAIPVIEAHLEEIVAVLKEIAVDIGRNPQVRSAFKKAASEMFHDPRLRQIFAQSLRDVFEDSQSLRDLIRKNWESEAGNRVVLTLEEVVDPWLRNAGTQLLGTPEAGLTPEFVAVLRSQILAKDRRWIVAYVQDDSRISDVSSKRSQGSTSIEPTTRQELVPGRAFPRYPVLIEANKEVP